MPSKSKIKGSAFEREMAKFLSEKYDESFVRVPNSGAYIGGKNQKRTDVLSEGQIRAFKGDIIPPDDWIYFNSEAKSYADFQFHALMTPGYIPILESWINQTMEVAEEKDLNILFMKFNRKGKYIGFEKKILDQGLEMTNHNIYQSENHGKWVFVGEEEFWEKATEVVQIISTEGYYNQGYY
jgi:hypothetical protein